MKKFNSLNTNSLPITKFISISENTPITKYPLFSFYSIRKDRNKILVTKALQRNFKILKSKLNSVIAYVIVNNKVNIIDLRNQPMKLALIPYKNLIEIVLYKEPWYRKELLFIEFYTLKVYLYNSLLKQGIEEKHVPFDDFWLPIESVTEKNYFNDEIKVEDEDEDVITRPIDEKYKSNLVKYIEYNITNTIYERKKGKVNYWKIDLIIWGRHLPLSFYVGILDYIVELFWNDVIINLPLDQKVKVQLVCNLWGGDFEVTRFEPTRRDDFEFMVSFFKNIILTLSDYYLQIPLYSITFKYFIYDDKPVVNKTWKFSKKNKLQSRSYSTKASFKSDEGLDIYPEKHWKFSPTRSLPLNNDYKSWGVFIKVNNNSYTIKPFNKDYYYEIIQTTEDLINISCRIGNIDDLSKSKEIFRVRDRIINNTQNIYIREYLNNKNDVIYLEIYNDNKLILKTKTIECNFITKANKAKSRKVDNFITLDLETVKIGDVIKPVSISFYDGVETWSYNITNFTNFSEILTHGIKDIIQRKYNGYNVYLHNFSNFDSIFLLNTLASISINLKILKRDSNILNFTLNYGKNNQYKLNFRDSFLLIPSSLKDLSKNFEIKDIKDVFPLKFVSIDNLNYKGNVPPIDDFFNISEDEYKDYLNRFINKEWNMIEELEKYCELDCISLYKVIEKFNEFIWDLFSVDTNSTVTISSLTMKIFRTKFLSSNVKLPCITGMIFLDLIKAFQGGAVDIYKPYGKNITRIDVNSLYPYVMINEEFPGGTPIQFIGDYRLNPEWKSKLAIIEVEVETPIDIKHPVLIVKKDGVNIRPLGKWKGWYTSKELENTAKLGYKYKILRGYLFDICRPFYDFVKKIYKLRLDNPKGTPLNLIAKLLLNALFGRFGIKPFLIETEIIESEDLEDYFKHFENIIAETPLNNDKTILTYSSDTQEFYENEKFTRKQISLPISIFTTAYGRIHITQYINNDNLELYYTDTDSLDFKGDINIIKIGDNIGQIKYEGLFKEAVYLAPKLYVTEIDRDNKTVEKSKARGLKDSSLFTLEQAKSLLHKNTLITINQEKWFRNFEKSEIKVKSEAFTIQSINTKREALYDENNLWFDTKPVIINE